MPSVVHHLLIITLLLPFLVYAHLQQPPQLTDLEYVLYEQFLMKNLTTDDSLTHAMTLIAHHNPDIATLERKHRNFTYIYTERDCSVTLDDYTLTLHRAIIRHFLHRADELITLYETGDMATHRFTGVLLSIVQWGTSPCVGDPEEKKNMMYWRHWREAFTEHASGAINTTEMLQYILVRFFH